MKLAQRVSLLLAVLPFEADFYRKFGANATYVGHPLLDRISQRANALKPEEFRQHIGVNPGQKLVAFMPGSRRQEITSLLPVMLEAARELNKNLNIKWVLPLAGSIDRAYLESMAQPYKVDLTIITEGVYDLLAAADGAIIKSGTATLEAAILNTPMVIVYQVSKLSLFIYRRLQTREQRKMPIISGLPNIIMGREFVPELKQEKFTVNNITRELQRILTDAEYNAELRKELQTVKGMIGPGGVMARAAKEIANLIN